MSTLKIYLKNNKAKSIFSIISSLCLTYISFYISKNIKYIFNMDKGQFNKRISILIILYIGIYFLEMVISYIKNNSLYNGQRNLHRFCLEKVLKTEYSYVIENDVSAISSDIGTVASNVAIFFNSLLLGICTLVSLVTYMFIVFRVNIMAGLVSIGILPLFFIVTLGIKKKITHYQEIYRKYNNNMFSLGIEVLDSAKNIKSKNIEDFL